MKKRVLSVLLLPGLCFTLAGCKASAPGGTVAATPDNGGAAGTGNVAGETTRPSAEASGEGGFRVGYGRMDITPKELGLPLAGYGNTDRRLHNGVLSDIYTICIAVTDENDETVLMFSNDLAGITDGYYSQALQAVSKATGVPEDHISMTGSHTHSAPDTTAKSNAKIVSYNRFLAEQMVKAAQAALEDRKRAEIYVGKGETEKLNWVRRYVMTDGSTAGDNYGDFSKTIAGHESEADREMRVIQFKRAEGAKDIVMVSWQSHPHLTGGSARLVISADIIGEMKEQLDKEGYLSVYFQGGAGNINPWSNWSKDNYSQAAARANWRGVGQSLANTAKDILGSMTKVASGPIKVKWQTFTGDVNHTQDSLLPVAREVYNIWTTTNDKAKAMAIGAPAGIQSVYHAAHILQKCKMPLTKDAELSAFSFGDVAFTFAPCEQFDTNAKYIRENSPYAMTFALSYSYGGFGYMPSEAAYDNSGYEVTSCPCVKGTGEKLADAYVGMLREMHG